MVLDTRGLKCCTLIKVCNLIAQEYDTDIQLAQIDLGIDHIQLESVQFVVKYRHDLMQNVANGIMLVFDSTQHAEQHL